MKMKRRITKTIVVAVALLCVAACFTSCGKKYVGTWYNVENMEFVLVINKDDTFYYRNMTGTVKETENGIILETGTKSNLLTFTEWEGETALADNQDTFIKNYDKLKKVEDDKQANIEKIDKEAREYGANFFRTNAGKILEGHFEDGDNDKSYINLTVNEDQSYKVSLLQYTDLGGGEYKTLELEGEGTFDDLLSDHMYVDGLTYDCSRGFYKWVDSTYFPATEWSDANSIDTKRNFDDPCISSLYFVSEDKNNDGVISTDEYTGRIEFGVNIYNSSDSVRVYIDLPQK